MSLVPTIRACGKRVRVSAQRTKVLFCEFKFWHSVHSMGHIQTPFGVFFVRHFLYRAVLLPQFVSCVCTFVKFVLFSTFRPLYQTRTRKFKLQHFTITPKNEEGNKRRKQKKNIWWRRQKQCEYSCECVHSKENFRAHQEQRLAIEKKTYVKNKESNWKSQKHKWTIC